MEKRRSLSLVAGIFAVPVLIALAFAAATDEQKCQAAKLKTVGKYEFCLFKAHATQILKGTLAPDLQSCTDKFDEAWAKTETKYGSACPTSGDSAAIGDVVLDHVETVLVLLTGAPECGNGQLESPEACDGSDLGGEDCLSQGYTSGVLACNASCHLDTAGCTSTSMCVPGTCPSAGATCGQAGDGCGDTIECGTCFPPQYCGLGGIPSQCGGNCTPTSCPAIGAVCGSMPDGCGGTLSCGTCPEGQVCMGQPPNCALGTSCTPLSEAAACGSRVCGDASNGCGGILSCGTCPAGTGCTAAGACASSGVCIPRTCDQLAADQSTTACSSDPVSAAGCFCSIVANGCGGVLDCGSCGSGQVCGAESPNICH